MSSIEGKRGGRASTVDTRHPPLTSSVGILLNRCLHRLAGPAGKWLAALGLVFSVCAGLGQERAIAWRTVDGGGGAGSGGVCCVSGSVGQTGWGAMGAGNVLVQGGFWSFMANVASVPPVSLGGSVWYCPTNYPPGQLSGKTVSGVSVNLSGGLTTNALSASDGSFSLPGLPAGQNYQVGLAKSDDKPPANGVSTMDIALIRRHILGLALLDSPYKLLAADVNGSGTITTVDIALIRRLILGLTDTYPAGLWRFVPADYVFGDPTSPWDAPANRWYTNLLADASGQDFVAIKLGDVNNSWLDNGIGPQVRAGGGGGPQAASAVRFASSRQVAGPGEKVGVRVSAGGMSGLSSAQFTLGWDAKVLRYAGLGEFGLRGLGEGNFGTVLAESGKLTFSWDDPEGTGVDVAEGTTAFTVYFEVIGPAGSVSPVVFGDSPTAREASVECAPRWLAGEDGQVLTLDRPPVVSAPDIWATASAAITIPKSLLLAAATDPEGGVLTVSGASAPGGAVLDAGTNLVYQSYQWSNLTNLQDVLSFVVDDGTGGRTAGFARLHLIANGRTHLDVSQWLDTGVQVVVGGTPGQVYQIQASDDLLHWTVLETVSAGPTGAIELLDAAARTRPYRFYRAVPQ